MPAPSLHPWVSSAPPVPALPLPKTVKAWGKQREGIRQTLWSLLGKLPPRPAKPLVQIISREEREGYVLEKFRLDNGAGDQVPGYCFSPTKRKANESLPAILYCHWHGGQYEMGKQEMLETNATPVPAGPALARAGYVVLGIDAIGFGERHAQGPDGRSQKGSAAEMSAAKFQLWYGRSLWGMIVRDDLCALDYLASRADVDAARIGVTGISMGSTRSWWLMALDDRPCAAVGVACLTRYQDLIAQGMLKAHGIYYFVPGMLQHFDTEAVVACAAPRPMLFMTGDQDSGSPTSGVRSIGDIVGKVYALHGDASRFESHLYPGVGHVYLPEMWTKMTSWMDRWVKKTK